MFFSFYFSSSLQEGSNVGVLARDCGGFRVFYGGLAGVLFNIWSSSLVPDLRSSGVYFKTRAPQRRSPASSAPADGSSGHGGKRFPARGRHAPACCSSARVLATFHLFWPCTASVGVYGGRSSAGWYRGRRVSSTRRRLWRFSATVFSAGSHFGFFCFCVYSLVSIVDHSLSICNAQMFLGLFGVWVD